MMMHSPNSKELLDKFFEYQDVGPFRIYDTGIDPVYFKGDNIVEYNYSGYDGYVKVETQNETEIMFKVNMYPNWNAQFKEHILDRGKPIDVYECNGMVCATVNKTGYLLFKFEDEPTDIIGFLISFLTIAIIIMLTFSVQRCQWI